MKKYEQIQKVGKNRKSMARLKNCEYDQEIPQSQTADNPVAPTITRHQEDNLSKAISSLFLVFGKPGIWKVLPVTS